MNSTRQIWTEKKSPTLQDNMLGVWNRKRESGVGDEAAKPGRLECVGPLPDTVHVIMDKVDAALAFSKQIPVGGQTTSGVHSNRRKFANGIRPVKEINKPELDRCSRRSSSDSID